VSGSQLTPRDAQPFHREDAFRPTAYKRLSCQTLERMKNAHRIALGVSSAVAAVALAVPSATKLQAGSNAFPPVHVLSIFIVLATYLLALVPGALLFTRVPPQWSRWQQAATRVSVAIIVLVATVFALLLPYTGLVITCSLVEACTSSLFTQQLVSALSVATFGSSFWLAIVVVPVFFFAIAAIESKHHTQSPATNAL
jgi:hypothetical protein